jgi:short-subunit dehydrogenase
MRNVVVVGATSKIAEETCKIFAEQGDKLYLVGRRETTLQEISNNLTALGADSVDYQVLDLNITTEHKEMLRKADQIMGGIDILLVAHGTLPKQKDCEVSFKKTLSEFETNTLSVISLLTHIANMFERSSTGTILVISSVAGDRGRKSNYIYGAAKGAVSIYLQGLRNRLDSLGVKVITIKPGFVDTPMTKSFSKGFLWETPEKIALGIFKAIDGKRDVVYLPWFWRYIMMLILLIPESIFKKLNF